MECSSKFEANRNRRGVLRDAMSKQFWLQDGLGGDGRIGTTPLRLSDETYSTSVRVRV